MTELWLAFAIKTARRLPRLSPYRLVAVLVAGGHVVAIGKNGCKTSPVIQLLCAHREGRDGKRVSLHAELDALRQSNGNARGAVMYVARVRADGSVGNAMPCGICQEQLARRGVRVVHYTTEDGAAGMLQPNVLGEHHE